MPTDAEQIAIILTQTLALIADLTTDPKPTYNVDGQQVLWGDYLARLEKTVDWCEAKIAGAAPFEIHSQGYT